MNKNRIIILGILITGILALTGCSGETKDTIPDNHTQEQDQSETMDLSQKDVQAEEPEADPIEEKIKNMTIEEKIGQMVIVGLESYILDDNTRMMIDKYHVGGFILFGRNVENPDQLLTLLNSLKNANLKNQIPLFLSVDEEGGRVSRMPDKINKLPSNETIGKMDDPDLSYKIGGILAEELRAFGLNMDFAPVLDINSNPDNPVIGDRSFGSDENIVSKLGIETMKGIQAGGIIPVVKHFPGHGDTSVDSHIGLPSVKHDMDRLKSFELVPFQKAIEREADAVMIAHILLNKIDPQNPASLSKTIITDLLREQMKFNGVVITDDMTMGAIVENYTISNAVVQAIQAGSDIVLVCHEQENEVEAIESIKKAVEDESIPEERIDESVYRILKLKQKYKLTDDKIESIDIEEINNKINDFM